MPIWVYLAFASIEKRKGALLRILACVVFSIYCIPWTLLFPDQDWVVQIFLLGDWSWFVMKVPVTFTDRVLKAVICSRANLVIENVALHQQVATLLKQRRRPILDNADRAFWVALRAAWPRWTNTLVIVKTDTVAKWHRERFRCHWAIISRQRHPGRPRIDATIRDLIREMATDGWGAPRIHGELMKLGFGVSEATVSRYMPRLPSDPDQLKRWMVFLRNHKDVIAAMDRQLPTVAARSCDRL